MAVTQYSPLTGAGIEGQFRLARIITRPFTESVPLQLVC